MYFLKDVVSDLHYYKPTDKISMHLTHKFKGSKMHNVNKYFLVSGH